jgi:hypothetical protein
MPAASNRSARSSALARSWPAPHGERVVDLEEQAFKRDRRFLLRLVLVLVVGVIGGLFVFGWLTGDEVAGCAAESFGGVTPAASPE